MLKMATKKVSGLCSPLSKFYRGNISSVIATQHAYCTMKENDNQVTHTGQVSPVHLCYFI